MGLDGVLSLQSSCDQGSKRVCSGLFLCASQPLLFGCAKALEPLLFGCATALEPLLFGCATALEPLLFGCANACCMLPLLREAWC